MDEFGISADGNNLGARLAELLMLLCQSSKLGRSDKGKVRGIKEEDSPFSAFSQRLQTHLPEIALPGLIRFKFKIRDVLSGSQAATVLAHSRPPSFFLTSYHQNGRSQISGHPKNTGQMIARPYGFSGQ
jgi:hypothetical protein